MKSLMKISRKEIRTLGPCVHGGKVNEAAERHRIDQRKILDFSASVNPLGPPQKILAAIKSNFWRIPFYPDSTSKTLKTAIAKHLGLNTDNIVVGNGSTELIWLFAWVFIKKGDEALIPAPTFGEYEIAVRRAGGRPKFVRLDKIDFRVKADDFIDQIRARTKVIFLCNPNNSTGKIIAKEELLNIVKAAEQKNVLVFIDEDFMDFVEEGKRTSFTDSTSIHKNLFILRSFTKFFALAGIRVGYGIGCNQMNGLLHQGKAPWNVNCLAQVAAVDALANEKYINETQRLITRERAHMLKGLALINSFKVVSTDANFVLVKIKSTSLTAAQLKEKLLKYGILIRDCSSFRGLDKYFFRIAIRTRKENAKLLKVMKSVLRECGKY